MSYILEIWEQPSHFPYPESVNGVMQQLAALYDQQPGANPKFGQLAAVLTRHYPDATMLSLDSDEPSCAWSDAPLDGKTERAVWALGINVSRLTEVKPLLVCEALALGLCLFDAQAGHAWLANGQCYPTGITLSCDTEKEEDDEYADVPTNRPLRERVFEGIKPYLVSQGFKAYKRGTRFTRAFPGGDLELYIASSADAWPCHGEFYLFVCGYLHEIEQRVVEMEQEFRQPSTIYGRPVTFSIHQRKWMEVDAPYFMHIRADDYYVTSFSQIEGVITHLQARLEQHLLPLLADCCSIAGVDRYLNRWQEERPSPLSADDDSGEVHLWSAYLTRNPALPALCDKYYQKHITTRSSDYTAPSMLKAINYIRANPLS